jgi:hypothetical protein
LTACGNTQDPSTYTPAQKERAEGLAAIKAQKLGLVDGLDAKLKVERATSEASSTPIGKPFPLGDCVAQAYAVSFTNVSPSSLTVITADCPTSTTETQHAGGKYPQTNTVVRPKRAP